MWAAVWCVTKMETTGIQCILFLFHSISHCATKSMTRPYISSPNHIIQSLTLIQLQLKLTSHPYTYSSHKTVPSVHIPYRHSTSSHHEIWSDMSSFQNKPMTYRMLHHHLTLYHVHPSIRFSIRLSVAPTNNSAQTLNIIQYKYTLNIKVIVVP